MCNMGYMSLEVLDVELVKKLAEEKGLKLSWLSQQIGVSRNTGYIMFREGLLPKDPEKKEQVIGQLAKLLGVGASKLRVYLKRA